MTDAFNGGSRPILPFAVRDRWIVTVESERVLVNVRHRTRWYVVERRLGHDDRIHWVASEQDAHGIAEMVREGKRQLAKFESDPAFQQFEAWYRQQPETVQRKLSKQQHKLSWGKPWTRRACLSRDRHQYSKRRG